jgi:hypothetical protein
MSGKIKNCKGPFYIYHLIRENYIGVTTNLHNRMIKHKHMGKYVDDYKVITSFDNLEDALDYEYKLQIENGFEVSKVKNQNGSLNPIARKLIHIPTNTIFDSIKEASEYLNISYDNLRRKETQIKNKLQHIN